MSAYYSKELPQQPFFVNGKAYRFDLIQLDDPALIQHFDSAAWKGIGGIIKISREDYESAIKKKTLKPSSSSKPQQREEVKQKRLSYGQKKSRSASVAVAVKPEPDQPPDLSDMSQYIPKTAKGVMS